MPPNAAVTLKLKAAAVFMSNKIIFLSLQKNPDTVHAHIDEIQAEMLLSNKVNTTKGMAMYPLT